MLALASSHENMLSICYKKWKIWKVYRQRREKERKVLFKGIFLLNEKDFTLCDNNQ